MKITKRQLLRLIKEEVDLQKIEPMVDAMVNVVQKEADKVPDEVRSLVLQALVSKLSDQMGSTTVELEEVTSEKQRRWACAQKDKSATDRPKSLSAAEAEEMCKSKIEEDG